jgi:hypothetical protein
MRIGQEAKLSMPNSQWTNAGKASNGESRNGVTSQSPKGFSSTQLRSGKAQRLIAGMGWHANLPKQSRWWTLESISGTEGSIQNWIAPPCWGSLPNRNAAEGQHSCSLLKTTALTTLHDLPVLPHCTIPTNLVDRRNQILLSSQSPGEPTSELLLICQYQDWIPKE